MAKLSKEIIALSNAPWFPTVMEKLEYVKVIRCKDCKHKHIKDNVWTCPFGLPAGCDFYCGYGERKTDQSDRPITCDYCKHWHGLKRDGRYWCSKHSRYMECCEEGERNET